MLGTLLTLYVVLQGEESPSWSLRRVHGGRQLGGVSVSRTPRWLFGDKGKGSHGCSLSDKSSYITGNVVNVDGGLKC
jgi:hypothetical protein